jgi:FMN phosphatase YigB (HAD superfamily)
MQCRTPQDLVRIIRRRSKNIDLISLDVFDTLVQRRIGLPEQAKVPAAREIVRLLAEQGRNVSVAEVLAVRKRCGDALCDAAQRRGDDPDCHIRPWFEQWLTMLLGQELALQHTDRLVEVEFHAEAANCHAPHGMLAAVRQIRDLGKLLVYISDSFFDGSQIDRLLDGCGYAGLLDRGYSSCECKALKRTGRLFRYVLAEHGIDARRWLHAGDNRLSDVENCRRLGGQAVHFWPCDHAKRIQRLERLEWLVRRRKPWAGAPISEWCRAPWESHPVRDLAYDVGYWVLGPALANFMHCVTDRIGREDARLAVFPAREGFILRQLFEKFLPQVLPGREVPSVYAFLTRSATFPASVAEIGPREIQIASSFSSHTVTVRDFLSRLGQRAESFREPLLDCGISSLDHPLLDPFNDPSFQKFLRHPRLCQAVRASHEEHRSVLEQYLGELGFWEARRVAFVDIGWQGSVQDTLTRVFRDHPRWPKIFGLYMGFLKLLPILETAVSLYEGILYDRLKQGAVLNPLPHFLQLFEFATRAPHASTQALRRDAASGHIVPVFKSEESESRRHELQDRPVLTRLQTGILEFADAYAATIRFQDQGPEACTPFVLMQLDRFLRLPRVAEGKLFSVHNAEDFGIDCALKAGAPPFRLGNFAQWRRDFLRHALWREGAVASLALPGLVHLFNLTQVVRGRFS